MRLQAVLFLALLSSSNQHEIVKRESSEKRVVCYYTNWSVYRPGTAKFNPQNINPYLCTHLIYAFGGLDRENGLRPYDKYQDIEQGGYAKFTGLKTYNKELKTMLAIGGWNEGSARFSPLVADEERRKEFVKNVVKFLRINHFDGLDLDWEYPAFRDGGKPHDRENYAQLVQELREEFERESSKTGRVRLLLTMAVPAGIEYIDKGYDIPKLNKYLDFMNILTYDYHSAFEPSVNHHSPLYSLEEESEYNFDSQLTIDATIKHYLLKGADPDKLVLGIPTYGRSYTLFNPDSTDLGSPADGPGEQGDATREKGYLAYYEICAKVKEGWTVEYPKETAMGPYAFKDNQWVGYDDENIVKRKSEYVNERQLGGIMFWSIDNDDFRGNCHKRPYPLIEAAKEALFGKAQSKSSSSSRPNKLGSSKSSKGKNIRTTTTAPTHATPTVTTPDPPTTPDPGSDFVCKDEGFFPHPRDCKKYFWCLDSGPSNLGIVAHQFTCPSGLFFNKAADSCDFARNVICKKKSSTTTTTSTTTPTTTTSKSSGKFTTARTTIRTTTTTTTTTTTKPPVIEEEDEELDEDSEEDPQTIKQLINLIKKLGGVAELERQLEGSGTSGSDSTTPSISKSLYHRVINKVTPKYQTLHRNGPSGPQNEGLTRETVRAPSHRRDKPQYVTIRRERPSTTTESLNSAEYGEEYEAEEPIQDNRPKYKTIYRNHKSNDKDVINSNSEEEEEEEEEEAPPPKPERRFRPKYQPIERFRPKHQHIVDDEEKEEGSTSTLKYTNLIRSRGTSVADPTSSTSKYVTLRRQRPQQAQTEESDITESVLIEEEEVEDEETEAPPLVVTTVAPPTSTARARVKVGRVRRPYSKRVISRGTTTTSTTTLAPTTTRQRTTVQKLRQRLNKFRVDKTVPRLASDSIPDGNLTVTRPRKAGIRRVIRPVIASQNTAEDSQLGESYSRSVSKDTNLRYEKGQYLTKQPDSFIISEDSDKSISESYNVDFDEVTEAAVLLARQTIPVVEPDTSSETLENDRTVESSSLPDLANVAVAAIQSLATSAPTQSTEKYKITSITQAPPKLFLTTRQRPSRPPRPFSLPTSTPTTLPTRTRSSSPRPFTRTIKHHSSTLNLSPAPHRTSSPPVIYRDYDADYDAEPVDVPLSGKVRIHSDGYIECLDIGNFPHPFSCRKFISCAKMENGRLLGWEYTCPKGLSFDPIGGICNWNAGLGCKE